MTYFSLQQETGHYYAQNTIANKIVTPFMCISYWFALYDTLCS